MKGRRVEPVRWKPGSSIADIIDVLGRTCFEARNVHAAANLFRRMVDEGDTIFMGVAGAGPVGGMGGYIIDLIERGFVDVICSTGAQVYHDGHFAFELPVVQGSPDVDDRELVDDGTVRIWDTFIRLNETLVPQDKLFQEFARTLQKKECSTAEYTHEWGKFVLERAPKPERSFVAAAAKYGVPIFWDSDANHSIGMSNALLYFEGKDVDPKPSLSLLQGAAILYASKKTGFFEWGGGGPKNWIQTLAPMLSQVLGVEYKGADRGIQITTAAEWDGGLSGCSFNEAKSWIKYDKDTVDLVQVHGDYSVIAPLIIGCVLENCKPREPRRLVERIPELYRRLETVKTGT